MLDDLRRLDLDHLTPLQALALLAELQEAARVILSYAGRAPSGDDHRWSDPLRDLLKLQERINRLFQDSLAPGRPDSVRPSDAAFTPPADAYETAGGFVVQLEVPGVEERRPRASRSTATAWW